MKKYIYFDNAATTPLLPEVIEGMIHFMSHYHGNPSSIHHLGSTAKSQIEESRLKIATILNCSSSNIIFTSSGTESSNFIIKNAIENHGIKSIISSNLEHPCVKNTLAYYAKENTDSFHQVRWNNNFQCDLNHLEELLQNSKGKTLVCIMHVNNEIGVKNDIQSIGKLCKQYGALFFCDTVQSFCFEDLSDAIENVDFLMTSAHKFHGPKGIGFAYIKDPIKLSPLLLGGGQERGFRSGTENTIGIIGLTIAMNYMYSNQKTIRDHLMDLNTYFRLGLSKLPCSPYIICDQTYTTNKIITVEFPQTPSSELLVLNLDIHGIAVSGGSACSSGAEKPSYVYQQILPLSTGKLIRFSLSTLNTITEINTCLEILKKLV